MDLIPTLFADTGNTTDNATTWINDTTTMPDTTTAAPPPPVTRPPGYCKPWTRYPRCDPWRLFVDYFNAYFVRLAYAIGLPGNILIIVVLSRMRPINSSTVWLIALACSDLSQIMSRVVQEISTKAFGLEGTYTANWDCRLYYIVTRSFEYSSNMMLVALTVERFIAVWFPLKMNQWCSKTKAGWGVLVVFLITFLPNFHMLKTLGRHERFPTCIYFMEYRELYSSIVDEKILLSFYVTVPMCALVAINILIVLGLKRSSNIQKGISDAQAKEKAKQQAQINRMLLGATCWFVISVFPFVVYHNARSVMWWFNNRDEHAWRMYFLMPIFLMFWRFSNTSANFLLYVVAAKRFRHELMRVLTCGRFPRPEVKGGGTKTSGVITSKSESA